MSTDIKNQNTLFRFVSLRGPELTKKENITKRFVFHPDNATGFFFNAVTAKDEGASKWSAMRTAASKYKEPFTTSDLSGIDAATLALAEKITRERETINLSDLYNQLRSVPTLEDSVRFKLWDTCFTRSSPKRTSM